MQSILCSICTDCALSENKMPNKVKQYSDLEINKESIDDEEVLELEEEEHKSYTDEEDDKEEEVVINTMYSDSDHDCAESDDDDKDDDDDTDSESENDDNSVYLGNDIKIKKLLISKKYRKIIKLTATDQGSVWKAIAPKKYGKIAVVIKIAKKIYYKNIDFDLYLNHKLTPNEILAANHDENILKEIEILRDLEKEQKDSSNKCIKNSIPKIIDLINDKKNNNFMVILQDGGQDLYKFTTLIHKDIQKGLIDINEWKKSTKLIARKLINLISWMHTKINLCHLDVSLENILISNINWITYNDSNNRLKKKLSPNFMIKLIDFGASKYFVDSNNPSSFLCNSICGKPTYCSPQIFSLQNKTSKKCEGQKYDARKADIWSLGVCLFIMSIGCPPWSIPDERKDFRFQHIVCRSGLNKLLISWNRLNYIDNDIKELLNKIFVMSENQRISSSEIIYHSLLCNK